MLIQTEKVKTLNGITFTLYAVLPYRERTYNLLLQKHQLLLRDPLTPQI